MSSRTLQDLIEDVPNTAEYLRSLDPDVSSIFADLPAVQTNWIEEQRAWREGCAFMDQSYHMVNQYIRPGDPSDGTASGRGPIELFSDLAVNSFESFTSGEPPQAKQLVACNPDGYVIGDCILFYLDEDTFLAVGLPALHDWIRYNAEKDEYDVSVDVVYQPGAGATPADFRFELMGPDSFEILDEVTDDAFDGISFFEMDTVRINGHELYVLGHQMSGERGLELFGPYDYHDEIKDEIIDAGEEYGLRQLGSESYRSTGTLSAWMGGYIPAIYNHEDLRGFREWLPAKSFEANYAIGGSYESEEISDYYLTPNALNYEGIVAFDHDFIGREAVAEMVEDPDRTKVSLVWNSEDVIDVYASLFREGDTHQFMSLPTSTAGRYDDVRKGGEHIGVAKYRSYTYNEREMLSLGCIDVEYSEPGTEVTLVWGDEDSPKTSVERHVETTIRATVAPAPYVQRGRRD